MGLVDLYNYMAYKANRYMFRNVNAIGNTTYYVIAVLLMRQLGTDVTKTDTQ